MFFSHYSSPESRCQERIPVAWRHDIIYLFCTILPAPSHYLSFLESRRESEEQNVFCGTVAVSPLSPSSENNRLSDTGRRWQLVTSRRSSSEEQLTPDFPSAGLICLSFCDLCHIMSDLAQTLISCSMAGNISMTSLRYMEICLFSIPLRLSNSCILT